MPDSGLADRLEMGIVFIFFLWPETPRLSFFRSDDIKLEYIFKFLEHCTFPEYVCGTTIESHTCI